MVSKHVFTTIDSYLWSLTFKWAVRNHRNKPKKWVTARYYSAFNTARSDRWVFGDRSSGAYLTKTAWTKIVRHQMVDGFASADDPDLAGYWTARRRRRTPPIDDALFRGVVDLLGWWSKEWSQRPEWVTWIPSRRRDRLLADLARRLGEVGGLPVIPVLRRVANTPRQDELDVSSRQASNVLDALTVAPTAQVPPGPVLLLDDTARPTWTITVAGALLREAGSGRVLPFVLHRQP